MSFGATETWSDYIDGWKILMLTKKFIMHSKKCQKSVV